MSEERTPRYLRREDNGEVFGYTIYLMGRKDITWIPIYDAPTPTEAVTITPTIGIGNKAKK